MKILLAILAFGVAMFLLQGLIFAMAILYKKMNPDDKRSIEDLMRDQ